MTERGKVLAGAVRESKALISRYFKRFDDTNHTVQAEHLPNHFAWTLGHLALTLNRTAERFDGKTLPDTHFLTGDGRSGTRDRFDTESVCFGSHPVADPAVYPARDRCVAIFEAAIERLACAIERSDDAQLDTATQWANHTVPLWSMAVRMVFHNGTHCGQLADLRRALGLGSIFT
jgi:hypothetical protein